MERDYMKLTMQELVNILDGLVYQEGNLYCDYEDWSERSSCEVAEIHHEETEQHFIKKRQYGYQKIQLLRIVLDIEAGSSVIRYGASAGEVQAAMKAVRKLENQSSISNGPMSSPRSSKD